MKTETLFDNELDAGPSSLMGPPRVGEEAARIEIRRDREWFGKIRDYEIFVDGVSAPPLGRSGPVRYRVRPGWHSVMAKMDWCRSETVSVYLQADQHVILNCGTADGVRGLNRSMLVLLAATFLIGLPGILIDRWFPHWKEGITALLVQTLFFVCLATLGLCEILLFSKMMPWKPPGSLIQLVQVEVDG